MADNYYVNLNTMDIHHTLLCIKCEKRYSLSTFFMYVIIEMKQCYKARKTQPVVNSASDVCVGLQECNFSQLTAHVICNLRSWKEWKKGNEELFPGRGIVYSITWIRNRMALIQSAFSN